MVYIIKSSVIGSLMGSIVGSIVGSVVLLKKELHRTWCESNSSINNTCFPNALTVSIPAMLAFKCVNTGLRPVTVVTLH